MVWSSGADPYLDPETGILANKVGATKSYELAQIEADLATVRSFELFEDPPKPTSDFVELAAIHRHLFQDIYSWAGTFRNVDIRKNVDNADAFAPHQRITLNIQRAEEQLRADAYLQDLGRLEFTRRIAHHYDQFNFIHPFREGNGRAQRLFWLLVSRRAGWDLDWRNVTGQMNVRSLPNCRYLRKSKPFDKDVQPGRS